MPQRCNKSGHLLRYFDGRCQTCHRAALAKQRLKRKSGLSVERAKISQDILDGLGVSDGKPSEVQSHALSDEYAELLIPQGYGYTARVRDKVWTGAE